MTLTTTLGQGRHSIRKERPWATLAVQACPLPSISRGQRKGPLQKRGVAQPGGRGVAKQGRGSAGQKGCGRAGAWLSQEEGVWQKRGVAQPCRRISGSGGRWLPTTHQNKF